MARMKDMLIERIDQLSEESGYDFEWLMKRWFGYCTTCMEDDEPIDWEYFQGVTLEQDW